MGGPHLWASVALAACWGLLQVVPGEPVTCRGGRGSDSDFVPYGDRIPAVHVGLQAGRLIGCPDGRLHFGSWVFSAGAHRCWPSVESPP